jgi:hypothetical protein
MELTGVNIWVVAHLWGYRGCARNAIRCVLLPRTRKMRISFNSYNGRPSNNRFGVSNCPDRILDQLHRTPVKDLSVQRNGWLILYSSTWEDVRGNSATMGENRSDSEGEATH